MSFEMLMCFLVWYVQAWPPKKLTQFLESFVISNTQYACVKF